jgi:hypothetical protein
MPVRGEMEGEPGRSCRPRDQTREPELTPRRDEQQREPDASQRAGKAGELGQRGGSRTKTAARAV